MLWGKQTNDAWSRRRRTRLRAWNPNAHEYIFNYIMSLTTDTALPVIGPGCGRTPVVAFIRPTGAILF